MSDILARPAPACQATADHHRVGYRSALRAAQETGDTGCHSHIQALDPAAHGQAQLIAQMGAELRAHAALGLGLIGADDAIPELRAALELRASTGLQREAALALSLLGDRKAAKILTEIVKEGSTEYVRGSAAVALGRLATPRTAEELRDYLADEDNPDTTRAFVAVALGLVMDRRPFPVLTRVWEHYNHRMAVAAMAEVLTLL